MSQNQLYFFKTRKYNVFLKRSNNFFLFMALICVVSFSTVCLAEIEPKFHGDITINTKTSLSEVDPASIDLTNLKNPDANRQFDNVISSDESKTNLVPDLGFIHAFIASISVILVSELGDKTFFIAAIMAMRHPRLTVFVGAITALALMTILSAVFGMAATIIPRVYTYYISTALFAIFGLKMLKEGYYMSNTEAHEELEEVQLDLRKRDDELEREVSATLIQDAESGVVRKNTKRSAAYLATRVLMQAFSMTFLAEWGDRSQLTTIILSAREDVYGVIAGGILGHSICTGIAVVGGRMIAQKISVRTVTIVGGVVFLIFALSALFISPNES